MPDNKDAPKIELSFGPAWARQSPEKWVQRDSPRPERSSGRVNPESGARRSRYRDAGRRQDRPGSRSREDRMSIASAPPLAQAEAPDLKISFIPERSGLKPLAEQLAKTRRAYPLFEIAAMCLSKPDYYALAVEAADDDRQAMLYQCAECQFLFADRQTAMAHCVNRHCDLFYVREEQENAPPQGNFTCVARCTLSGKLLGPPNYHQFNERLQELHRARFAHMPLDQYRKKILNESDAAIIEQWKKEVSRKTVYRTKLLNQPLVFERTADLERHFAENYATALIREGRRFVLPAKIGQAMDDRRLTRMIHEAWQKETRFPINIAFSIQQRFSRLGLHAFKAAGRLTFVSAIKPHPIDPAKATATVRSIIEWISINPRKTRQDLVRALVPQTPQDPKNVADVMRDLIWLIDRGHVIEFANGMLAAPGHPGQEGAQSRKPSQGAVLEALAETATS